MILPESYDPDWIREKRKTFYKSDPAIIETVIYALTLVEQLAQTDLSFTFKGGTSLLLILPGSFRIDDAVLASSKTAYLAAIQLTGYTGDMERWNSHDVISKYHIVPKKYQFLNKRRIVPGGALFYWYQTLRLLKKI